MDRKSTKFLWKSFCCMLVVCAVVFIGLIIFLARRTDESIEEVSEIYMSEMGLQLQEKFDAIISLRMDQVEGVISETRPESGEYTEEMADGLRAKAEVRKFSYLGIYTQNGELVTVYGEPVSIADAGYFEDSLRQSGKAVGRGTSQEEKGVLLLGRQADYPLKDGRKGQALVAGIPMEYLDSVLFHSTEGASMYFHIIDENGRFVIRDSDVFKDNYFERIMEKKEIFEGKTPETYVGELKEAMGRQETYYTFMSAEGKRMHIYSSPLLANSQWYLIMVMPDDMLQGPIVRLDSLRLKVIVISMAVIVAGMVLIFIQYIRMSRHQLKELDKERKEAVYANQSKSEFLSSMSHDIRTPMNAIIGMTEIALKNSGDQERVVDCLQKVQLSSRHLLGLINDVLDISKIESGKMTLNIQEVSLRDMADDIVNIIQPQIKARKQYFDIFIQDIKWENIWCDDVRLNQVLLNLLSNALKFTPEEGRINVHIFQEESPLGGEYIRTHFKVEDNGIGMSTEFQEKIFDSFTREESVEVQHITGTGLGMAITKNIVDIMGGTIELKSELQKGSRFHITLDFKKGEQWKEEKLPEWNVLIVDDNEQLCESAAANLEEIGVHAEWILDGEKALQMIAERHKKKDDYHFVLLDWEMSHRDGLDIREYIHECGKNAEGEQPVFLLSAYSWSDIGDESELSGMEGFISKPLFKSTLYEKLSQYTEKGKKEEKKKEQEINFAGKRLLIAEDNELNWEIAYEVLSAVGFELEHAVDGRDCLEKFEQSETGFYDAILMDVRMPVMNGYESTKAIRALERKDRDLPIIAMTADAFTDDIQVCLESGMNAHAAKPLNVDELMHILQKFMNS